MVRALYKTPFNGDALYKTPFNGARIIFMKRIPIGDGASHPAAASAYGRADREQHRGRGPGREMLRPRHARAAAGTPAAGWSTRVAYKSHGLERSP